MYDKMINVHTYKWRLDNVHTYKWRLDDVHTYKWHLDGKVISDNNNQNWLLDVTNS